MNDYCTVYIDEAGDLGINRGTRWFVLSAVIVNNVDEPMIRKTLDQARSRLNLKTIHFRNLRDFNQKSYVVNELSKLNFCFTNVLIDTTKMDFTPRNPSSNKSVIIYNYACRLLLERVSWYLRDNNLMGKVILSSRGTARDDELIKYIKTKLINYDYNTISNRFTEICSKTFGSWDLLQLADVCATSMFYAYEINSYGFTTPCFMRKIKPHLYNYNGKIKNYGIKYYSDNMMIDKDYYNGRIICENK